MFVCLCVCVYQGMYKVKVAVHNSNPVDWSNSSQSSSCPFRVCTQKNSGVRTQRWLCEYEKTLWFRPSHTKFQQINMLLQEHGRERCNLIGC